MWLWLRKKKQSKSFQLCYTLLGYVTALHLMVLFGLLFVYKDDNHTLTFTVNRAVDLNAAVVFLPLQKRASAPVKATGPFGKPTRGAEPLVEKKVEEKVLKSSTAKAEKKPTSIATAFPKKKIKSADKKSKKLIAQKKPTFPEKKVVPKKEELKKEIITDSLAKKILEIPLAAVAADVPNAQVNAENVQYLGQLDLEELHMESIINEQVMQHWSPPPGISKKELCELNMTVGGDGKLNLISKKSSSSAIFEVSIRSALREIVLPKQFWGKNFTLVFKP